MTLEGMNLRRLDPASGLYVIRRVMIPSPGAATNAVMMPAFIIFSQSFHPRFTIWPASRLNVVRIAHPSPRVMSTVENVCFVKITSVDFSVDGDWLRSNCEGGHLHIWDTNKGKHQVRRKRRCSL